MAEEARKGGREGSMAGGWGMARRLGGWEPSSVSRPHDEGPMISQCVAMVPGVAFYEGGKARGVGLGWVMACTGGGSGKNSVCSPPKLATMWTKQGLWSYYSPRSVLCVVRVGVGPGIPHGPKNCEEAVVGKGDQ